jgi:low affinity Fe/Cu permease
MDTKNQIAEITPGNGKRNSFERFSSTVTKAAGSSTAFIAALALVVGWLITGPIFKFSENWQLFINTGTTIITFLMVFLIQKSQNKDSLAIQLKLNELVAAHEFASNRLVSVEDMTSEELQVIQKYYSRLSEFTKKEESLQQSHSIDDARDMHDLKKEMEQELEAFLEKKTHEPPAEKTS